MVWKNVESRSWGEGIMVFDPLPQYYRLIELYKGMQAKFVGGENEFIDIELINDKGIKTDSCEMNQIDFLISQIVTSKLFTIEKNVCEAIKKTKPCSVLELPFNSIILVLENLCLNDNNKLKLVWVRKTYIDKKTGIDYLKPPPTIKKLLPILKLSYIIIDKKNKEHLRSDYIPLEKTTLKTKEVGKINSFHFPNKIKEIVQGIINFINNPEVEIIEKKPSEEHNQKRIKKNKIPHPTRANSKITGKLKIYLENFRQQTQRYGFEHRFWVRGHFMHWRSERYTNKKGKKTWVLPYIKGKGILIKKNYSVVKSDD